MKSENFFWVGPALEH